MKVLLIAGARPNFMKIAPIYRAAKNYDQVECKIVHTGQHYDFEMSQAFFEDLDISKPDFFLNAGSGSHAVQTSKIMVTFEKLCEVEKPDLVIVVGDVNSTLACSIVAKKLLIEVAHVEAGLRSFDMKMPEEINRIVTDSISDYFFVTEESGITNLRREGRCEDKIYFVGNVMIDNLFHQLKELEKKDKKRFSTYDLKKNHNNYIFLTLHRPSNVDFKDNFEEIAAALNRIAQEKSILFPVHPRTQKMMHQFDIKLSKEVVLLPPLGFRESLFLWKDAALVMTDSGGLQEETTALGVPCITLRENTERPITIEMGTNVLAGNNKETILEAYSVSIGKRGKEFLGPPKWDGRASERIWEVLINNFANE
jgi:UDP-N-acetylglucosamine 2-epimerase (non-hydrolysing)